MFVGPDSTFTHVYSVAVEALVVQDVHQKSISAAQIDKTVDFAFQMSPNEDKVASYGNVWFGFNKKKKINKRQIIRLIELEGFFLPS